MAKKQVAIVLGTGVGPMGGVRRTAKFLYERLRTTSRYEPSLISLAASARDEASVRLLSPPSWVRGIRILNGVWRDISYKHVGAMLVELEFQRYRHRPILTEYLQKFDLIQVVSGTPAVAAAVTSCDRPVCLFVATTMSKERVSVLRQTSGIYGLWLRWMTSISARVDRYAARQVEHIFAESDYTRDLVLEMAPESAISLGPPGVDTGFFHPGSGKRLEGHLLFVGRFDDPRKNLELLLEAYGLLCAAVPRTPRLALVGRAPLAQRYWSMAEAWNIRDRIDTYIGVNDDVLAGLYRDSSLYVLPSDEEGLGIVILEAMASGLPVVSTRCGGPETAVVEGETGYLTSVGDAQALAQAIQRLVEDPDLRQRMGKAGRQRVERKYSLEAASKVYLETYDELLGC